MGVKPLRRSVLKHSDSTQGSPKRTESPCSLVDKKGRRRSISGLAVPEVQVVDIHPLEEEGRLHEGQLWVVGNRRLVSLNLSRNQIGETGLRQLLEMVKVIVVVMHVFVVCVCVCVRVCMCMCVCASA